MDMDNIFDEFLEGIYNGPDYQEQIERMLYIKRQMRGFREEEVTTRSIKEHNYLEALSLLVQAWPASDIRAEGSYHEKARFDAQTDAFLEDVAKGLQLEESRRSLKDKSVVFDIMLQNNLDEFDEYNAKVKEHNGKWLDNGANLYDFDPVTGYEERLKDTFVDEIAPTSVHHISLNANASSGNLAKSAPKMKRSKYGTLEYRVSAEGDIFTIGFIARDKNNKILYYNEIIGDDMSLLVRRSVQEIWGNFKMSGYAGSPYAGISYLLKGHKLRVCKDRENVMPDWVKGRRKKKPTSYKESGKFFAFLTPVLRFWIPLLIGFYGTLVVPFRVASGYDSSDFLITKVLVTMALIWFSLKLSHFTERSYKESRLIDKIN